MTQGCRDSRRFRSDRIYGDAGGTRRQFWQGTMHQSRPLGLEEGGPSAGVCGRFWRECSFRGSPSGKSFCPRSTAALGRSSCAPDQKPLLLNTSPRASWCAVSCSDGGRTD
eukprot:2882126-Pleurochrysis_carterae.AAC.3